MLEKIKSFLRWWMHMNFLKVNGGVDPCAALRARVTRLEEALRDIDAQNTYSAKSYGPFASIARRALEDK